MTSSLDRTLVHKTATAHSRVDDLTVASPLSVVISAPSAPSVSAASLSAALSAAGVCAAVLFKLRLDQGDLLVMDGLTQTEYEHSAASELSGPPVNLTFRWITHHVKSCPRAGLIGGAVPSGAQDLVEPHSCGGGQGNENVHDLFISPPVDTRYMLSLEVYI